MASKYLTFHESPALQDGTMVLGFSGWMDGGEVSTGVVEYLVDALEAEKVAEIDPSPFYIYNFPGSMEVTSLFRPHVTIEDGLIVELEEPVGTFHCSRAANLVLFQGREPNLCWREYAECLFEAAERFNVRRIYFVGSVAGLVPHTREPRMYSSASTPSMLAHMRRHGIAPSNYEGPGSFVTYLTTLGPGRGVEVATLVVETPAYVSGRNVRSIAAVVRKLAAVADVLLDRQDLDTATAEFVERLDEAARSRPELEELIRKLETDYDEQVSQSMSDELKAWLERQGIRLE